MATATTPHNLPVIESTDKIAAATTGDNLREDINALAQATNTALVAVDPVKRTLTAADSMDTLTAFGLYRVLNAANADALGLPRHAAAGTAADIEVKPVGAAVVQEIKYLAPVSENWQRELYSNGVTWGPYHRTDFHRPAELRNASGAGMKIAPQAITLGHGGSTTTGAGFVRGLLRLASTVSRVRIHIQNRNPRFGGPDGDVVALPTVAIGRAATGVGTQNTVLTVDTGVNTGTAGYTSRWIDAASYAGRDVLISYDWSATGVVQNNIGTGYTGTGTGATGTGTATKVQTLPLFVWLEVEIPASTPVIAAYGDSLSCGVGATNVVYDSPVSQLARTLDAVPVHFAASGDSMVNWDALATKWAMYGDMPALADAVIFGMGSNDVFGGATLAELQARHAVVMGQIKSRISQNVYAATIMPRTAVTGALETTRRSYNTWLKTHPGIRAVFDFAASISGDDETITPAYDSDGIHLTTTGYAQNAALLVKVADAAAARVLALETSKVTIDNSVGRAGFAWDIENNRQQMIYFDSGLRDITALIPDLTSGTAQIHRTNNSVTLYLDAVAVAGSGTFTYAGLIPAGFRPAATTHDTTLNLVAGTDQYRISISTAGNVSLYSYVTGKLLRATITFTTNQARPASLPGTAVGAPV